MAQREIPAMIVGQSGEHNVAFGKRGREYKVVKGHMDNGFFEYCRNKATSKAPIPVQLAFAGEGFYYAIAPDDYHRTHTSNKLFLVDTDYPEGILRPTRHYPLSQERGDFFERLYALNDFADPPFAELMSESITIYRGVDHKPFWTDREMTGDTGARAGLLRQILRGELDFQRRERLNVMVNTAGETHADALELLSRDHYFIERHRISKAQE